jgi:phage terminase large subunit-like protein
LFEELEDQLCCFTNDFDLATAGFSPDRADALVWANTELLGGENCDNWIAAI